jgi:hypothetical protein
MVIKGSNSCARAQHDPQSASELPRPSAPTQQQESLIDGNSIPDQCLKHQRLSQPETLTGTRLGSHGYALEV